MQSVISIGGFHIYLFGITIALGLIAGYYITNSEIKRKKLDEKLFGDLAMVVMLSALVGARLYYVLVFQPQYYLAHPIEIFMVRNGGMSIQGAILGGCLSAGIYLKMKGKRFMTYADAIVPGLAFGQFLGRIGCDVYGRAMEKAYPWGMIIGGQRLHPVQIYEGLLDLVLFAFLWKRRDKIKFKGQLFIEYLVGFGLIRGFVEFFRWNPIWLGPFTVAHLTSFVMIGFGLILYLALHKRNDEGSRLYENKTSSIKFYAFIAGVGLLATIIFYTIRG